MPNTAARPHHTHSSIQFCPANATALLPYAAAANARDDLLQESPEVAAYASGTYEGELAFALSVADTLPGTIARCRSHLLIRLGLCGDNLTIEQNRTFGFIAGLLCSLEDSLSGGDQ